MKLTFHGNEVTGRCQCGYEKTVSRFEANLAYLQVRRQDDPFASPFLACPKCAEWLADDFMRGMKAEALSSLAKRGLGCGCLLSSGLATMVAYLLLH